MLLTHICTSIYYCECYHYAIYTSAHTHTTILWLSGFCPGQPGWAGTRRNIHPLRPIVVISCLLSASSIYCNPWHPPCSIDMPEVWFHNLSPRFLWSVYLLARHHPLHTPYISSPSHCLLFAAHAHTVTTCFAVVPRLYHLISHRTYFTDLRLTFGKPA